MSKCLTSYNGQENNPLVQTIPKTPQWNISMFIHSNVKTPCTKVINSMILYTVHDKKSLTFLWTTDIPQNKDGNYGNRENIHLLSHTQ